MEEEEVEEEEDDEGLEDKLEKKVNLSRKSCVKTEISDGSDHQ